MVDISNEVFTALKTALAPTIVTEPFNGKPPKFPIVTFDETENVTNIQSIDSGGEYASQLAFTVEIYDNTARASSVIKKLRQQVDAVLGGTYHMNRTFSDKTPNYSDTNVTRYTMRYDCVCTKDGKIYRR